MRERRSSGAGAPAGGVEGHRQNGAPAPVTTGSPGGSDRALNSARLSPRVVTLTLVGPDGGDRYRADHGLRRMRRGGTPQPDAAPALPAAIAPGPLHAPKAIRQVNLGVNGA